MADKDSKAKKKKAKAADKSKKGKAKEPVVTAGKDQDMPAVDSSGTKSGTACPWSACCKMAALRKLSLGALIATAVLYLDQYTKFLVNFTILPKRAYELADEQITASLSRFSMWLHHPENFIVAPPGFTVETLPFLNLIMVWNPGVTFGFFGADSESAVMTLLATSSLIVLILTGWLLITKYKFVACSLALVIGGALGNILDRLRFGAVVDFMDFYIDDWHYPAFNLADSAIVLGIAMLMFHSLILEPKEDSKKADRNDEKS